MDFNGCILVQSTKICIRITQVREFINWLIVLTKLSTTLMTEGLLWVLGPQRIWIWSFRPRGSGYLWSNRSRNTCLFASVDTAAVDMTDGSTNSLGWGTSAGDDHWRWCALMQDVMGDSNPNPMISVISSFVIQCRQLPSPPCLSLVSVVLKLYQPQTLSAPQK